MRLYDFGRAMSLFGAGLPTPPESLTGGLQHASQAGGSTNSACRACSRLPETCGQPLGRGRETRAQLGRPAPNNRRLSGAVGRETAPGNHPTYLPHESFLPFLVPTLLAAGFEPVMPNRASTSASGSDLPVPRRSRIMRQKS